MAKKLIIGNILYDQEKKRLRKLKLPMAALLNLDAQEIRETLDIDQARAEEIFSSLNSGSSVSTTSSFIKPVNISDMLPASFAHLQRTLAPLNRLTETLRSLSYISSKMPFKKFDELYSNQRLLSSVDRSALMVTGMGMLDNHRLAGKLPSFRNDSLGSLHSLNLALTRQDLSSNVLLGIGSGLSMAMEQARKRENDFNFSAIAKQTDRVALLGISAGLSLTLDRASGLNSASQVAISGLRASDLLTKSAREWNGVSSFSTTGSTLLGINSYHKIGISERLGKLSESFASQ
ncbi:hypothetical protein [Pedobacter agri]|uniref:hypothetical protein n=1 Tax=Pedobacter agri TaxID=454586 RepID=UPI0029307163|nr:hypothetical protein [Pedobacter agri]